MQVEYFSEYLTLVTCVYDTKIIFKKLTLLEGCATRCLLRLLLISDQIVKALKRDESVDSRINFYLSK